MKFGVVVPNSYEGVYGNVPFAEPREIVKFAQIAESLGYDSIWGIDLIVPSQSRRVDQAEEKPPMWYELLISLAYMAAVTNHIKLAAGVIVVPLREPVLLAKQLATLDRFSEGRFVFGVGVGSTRHEFESLRPREGKSHRGDMMDEALEAVALLLSGERVSHSGTYYEFHDVSLHPTPIQDPFPIYISGNALKNPERVARRVAKWGTGWLMSVATNSESINERIDRLRSMLDAEGRSLSEIDFAAVTVQSIAKDHETAVSRYRNTRIAHRRTGGQDLEQFASRNLVGTPDEVIEKVHKLIDDGATSCIVTNHAIDTFQELEEQVQWFAEEIMPHFSEE